MKCPLGYKIWEMEDAALANHIAECAVCRQQLAEEQLLKSAFATLEELAPPVAINDKFHALQAATAGKSFDCCATRNKLEEWQAGELPAADAFLLEEHLFSCANCSTELTLADAIQESLLSLPAMEAPAAIGERVAAGRIPWWQRWLLPTPAFSPRLALAGTLVLGLVVMLGTILHNPQINIVPQVAEMPAISEPVQPNINNDTPITAIVPEVNNTEETVITVKPPVTVKKAVAARRIINTRNKHFVPAKIKNISRPILANTNGNKPIAQVAVVTIPPRIPEATVVATARGHIENSLRLSALQAGDARGYAASNLTDSGDNATLVCSM